MKSRPVAALGLMVGAAMVWLLTADLPWPARLFVTALAVPLPALAIAQMRILARLGETELPRLPVYVSTCISLWLLALMAVTASAYAGFTAGLIGLRPLSFVLLAWWIVFILASALALYAFIRYFDVQESAVLYQLLPRTVTERLVFVFVSFTAGICEELVFRGFLIAALTPVVNSAITAMLLSSILFGLLHAYQGVIGGARAAVLGIVLAVPFVATGSLLPSVIAHTLIDILAGLWLVRDADAAYALH
jgi:membrane protease YdiL (CAAX protease family)